MRFVCNCTGRGGKGEGKGEGGGEEEEGGGGRERGRGLRIYHNYVAGKYGHTVALVLIARIELQVFLEFANF